MFVVDNAGFKWGRKKFTFYGVVGLPISDLEHIKELEELAESCSQASAGTRERRKGDWHPCFLGMCFWTEDCSKCVCYEEKKQRADSD